MDNDKVKELFDEQKTLFEEFKKQNDKRIEEQKTLGEAHASTIGNVEKINEKLAAIEKQMAVFNRPDFTKLLTGVDAKDPEAEQRKMAFESYVRKGPDGITKEEKVLLVSDDTTGGFLAPTELALEIDKNVVEISSLRPHARVRTTANRSIDAPTRTGEPTAEFVGEGKAPAESQSSYGRDQFHTHILAATVEVSQEDLEDSGFDLMAEISSDVAEQFALREGTAFVTGNGENQPQGFINGAGITSTDTTNSLLLDEADDVIDMQFRLKSFYWPFFKWFLNRTYIGAIRKLKDNDNQYLWQPGLNGPTQMTLLGRPVVELPDMASTSSINAGDVVLAAADLQRGYWIVDRRGMAMVRDDFTKAHQGVIRLIFRKRVGGQTRRSEAIELLDLKA